MSRYLKNIRMALIVALLCMVGQASAQTIKGTIVDKSGEPVIGAAVMEQGAGNNGTVTDIDGNYSLNLKGNSKKVTVSYVGMKTQTLSVAGKNS